MCEGWRESLADLDSGDGCRSRLGSAVGLSCRCGDGREALAALSAAFAGREAIATLRLDAAGSALMSALTTRNG